MVVQLTEQWKIAADISLVAMLFVDTLPQKKCKLSKVVFLMMKCVRVGLVSSIKIL